MLKVPSTGEGTSLQILASWFLFGQFVRWFASLALFLGVWAALLFDVYPLHLQGTALLALQFVRFHVFSNDLLH